MVLLSSHVGLHMWVEGLIHCLDGVSGELLSLLLNGGHQIKDIAGPNSTGPGLILPSYAVVVGIRIGSLGAEMSIFLGP